jgi:hypothetical protein
MEDGLIFVENGRGPHLFENGSRPQMFGKGKMTSDFLTMEEHLMF